MAYFAAVAALVAIVTLCFGVQNATHPDTSQVQSTPPPVISLDEEEISDVSLSTFYVFDHEKRWSTSSRLTTRSEDA